MKKNRSNRAWIHEHITDPYVRQARREGYRSRAAFKLLEIDAQDRLIRAGMTVVDLGSAPGSWSQVAAQRAGPGGKVIALDLLAMEALPGVEFVQGDFREQPVLEELEMRLEKCPVDLVLSDMAPNMSGIGVSDQARIIHLAELTLEFAMAHLRPGGNMLLKLFRGSGFEQYRRSVVDLFGAVVLRKPKASRDRSSEVYLLAQHKRSTGGRLT
jgi:23S rRNA (uridine2552-2'-O)-methyltransferase